MSGRSGYFVATILLALSLTAQAELMEFTYTFSRTAAEPLWADGATLTVSFDGTIQADSDTVAINSIGSATLDRPGLPVFNFPSIANNEIETIPAGGTPVVSFSGTTLNFNVCPSGFTIDSDGNGSLDSCAQDVDGGFSMTYGLSSSAGDSASAADNSGTTVCMNASGCPVDDSPVDLSRWLIVSDSDGDGLLDSQDNCPDVANALQLDGNGDGIGSACGIGSTQSFSDGARPLLGPSQNGSGCAMNGWLVSDCSIAVVEGENGPGDNALYVDSAGSHNRHFNFLTWEDYNYADTRFLGDLIAAEVTAIRFRARHAGGTEPLVLRAMVADSFNDGGSDYVVSSAGVTIEVGSGWATYEISLLEDEVIAGTKLNGQRVHTAPRHSITEILSAAAQVSLRHDPNFAGPGTPAPTDAAMEIDDIQLVNGAGSTGFAFLFLLSFAALRRSRPAMA